MSEQARVSAVDASSVEALRPRLCEILIDSVRHGASVGFLAPLDAVQADAYWLRVERAVAEGRCLLIAAGLAGGTLAGTVQLDVDTLPNQPHRATVSKLLVHSDERCRGVGQALMVGLERVALEAGRWLLTLDTAGADAKRLYERLGWTLSGVIPRYALNPDGSLTQTSFYWKELAAGLPSGLEPITASAGAPRAM